MNLMDWLHERADNCRAIASQKRGADRDGWLEDARYFDMAITTIENAPDLKLLARILHVGDNTPWARLLSISEGLIKRAEDTQS